ncbi:hypothetical protein TNCV_2987081 [Trichonephila clavipes]|nr:hypothetical protein TNCV_2987081 [Trichonephila clavipes]
MYFEKLSDSQEKLPVTESLRSRGIPLHASEPQLKLGSGRLSFRRPLRWRHHLYPPPQFRLGTGGEGNILQLLAIVISAATDHKTFGLTDLTSTYSKCTRRGFGGIGHQIQAVWLGIQCSNH